MNGCSALSERRLSSQRIACERQVVDGDSDS